MLSLARLCGIQLYNQFKAGVAPGFARLVAGFPDRGLIIRIEGIFLCIRTQFSVENSPTDTKFFPDGGATAPLWRNPWFKAVKKPSSYVLYLKTYLVFDMFAAFTCFCHFVMFFHLLQVFFVSTKFDTIKPL